MSFIFFFKETGEDLIKRIKRRLKERTRPTARERHFENRQLMPDLGLSDR